MPAEPPLSRETVERMAREVAGIDLSSAELDQLLPQLNRLLTDLAQISDADLQDVEPPLFFDVGAPPDDSSERSL